MNFGTVYRIDASGKLVTRLYSFSDIDGGSRLESCTGPRTEICTALCRGAPGRATMGLYSASTGMERSASSTRSGDRRRMGLSQEAE